MSRLRYLFLTLLITLLGCDAGNGETDAEVDAEVDAGRTHTPEAFEATAATRAFCALDDDAIEARITELLSELTLDEKISMMHGSSIWLTDGVWRVDGVERLGIPGLSMLDGPRGLSIFSDKNGTAFPVGMMRGATWSPELERRVGEAMAREHRSAGADVILAPTMNILQHPLWGRAQETYSEDTHHMAEMAVAFIQGVQSEGIIASAKHYAVNSIENTRHSVNVQVDERTLREIYLPHFRRAVQEAHVGSVMSAYNQVNDFYCDLNTHLLQDILKDEWGFSGFVESDWVEGTHGSAASVLAGLDIEMPFAAEFRRLARDVNAGTISEQEIDRSVRRILRTQFCFGLDTRDPVTNDPAARETPAHLALSREVAARGIVLLKNATVSGTSAPILPLEASAASLVVLGHTANLENIGDSGSSAVNPTEIVTALEGIQAAFPDADIIHIEGTTLDSTAEAQIRAADAVLIITGLTEEDEGENTIGAGDRETLALNADEVTLIRAVGALSERVITVLEGGSAITVRDWQEETEALLLAFYPGAQGGHALADVLLGTINPSGRLPFTMPQQDTDLPPFDNTSDEVTYSYFHGYRHLQNEGTSTQFPFGFGLSYTTFNHSNLQVSAGPVARDGTIEVTVDVTNEGPVAGRETVQVYVGAIDSRVVRAPRELRAFQQVDLDPGQTQTLSFAIAASDLAFWDTDANGWEVESLSYRIEVGHSSEDLPLQATVRIE